MFEDLMNGLREGRWLVPIAIGIGVVAVGVVLVVAWPTIKPKPKPQAQSLSTVVTEPDGGSSSAPQEELDPIPDAAVEAIGAALGEEDTSALSIHWLNDKQNVIVVRQQQGALNWKEYRFVEKGGTWVEK